MTHIALPVKHMTQAAESQNGRSAVMPSLLSDTRGHAEPRLRVSRNFHTEEVFKCLVS